MALLVAVRRGLWSGVGLYRLWSMYSLRHAFVVKMNSLRGGGERGMATIVPAVSPVIDHRAMSSVCRSASRTHAPSSDTTRPFSTPRRCLSPSRLVPWRLKNATVEILNRAKLERSLSPPKLSQTCFPRGFTNTAPTRSSTLWIGLQT